MKYKNQRVIFSYSYKCLQKERNLIKWRNRYKPNRNNDGRENFNQTVKKPTNTFKENRDCLY